MNNLKLDLTNFVEQMEANKQYFESIDEIMGTTFKLKIALNKTEESIFEMFIMLNEMYFKLKDEPQYFYDELSKIQNMTSNKIIQDIDFSNRDNPELIFTTFLDSFSNEVDNCTFKLNKEKESVSLSIDDRKMSSKISLYIEERKKRDNHRQLLYQTSLITLSNSFESLLFKLISFLVINSTSSKISEKSLTYQQIVELGDIGEAKDYLIEKTVEDVMRGSQITWLDFIAKNSDKSFFKELVGKEEKLFKEFFLRRNLIIHNNSVMNKKYLNGINVKDDPKDSLIGKQVSVSKKYLLENFDIIFLIGIKSSFYVMKNFFKMKYDEIFDIFHDIAFEKLISEEYDLSFSIFDMLWKNLEKFSATNKLLLTVNYMQTLKWTGRDKEFTKIMSQEDFSLAKDAHNMCISILNEDYRMAVFFLDREIKIQLLEGKDEIGTLNRYLNWPIFKEFKKSKELDEYLNANGYKEINENLPIDSSKTFDEKEKVCNNLNRRPIKYRSYVNKANINLKRKYRYRVGSKCYSIK